ncbi:transcriptional regulator [Actinoplanes sp. SE50]|uniref:MurR/RpiR family transcriptional regulator n=1 Tax=unclassified Actinoplanes TaxID=2626549 RepID=UPI00023ECC7C|nr:MULTISPECIES: SIS domain-containing protein [unclassified Actinoplanes]AEV83226.1 putative HTH-type transcriptional regulator [Actinoplanes sp. SE50/110]ATO81621.1 transcriptional regulator [Actinoplanes sp. SE50]SLL99029.1 SIS domain-containing protein [Actinoplanes sp. SE50/110]
MTSRGTPAERFDRNVQRRSAQVLKQRVLEQQRAEFDRALQWAAEHDAIERAAALIVSARRRFLVGNGKSLSYASLLASDLSAGLSGVHLVDGAALRPLDVLSDIRQGDLLIAVSLERYRRETVEVATAYVRHGGDLVLITDAEDAPLAGLATARIVVGTGSASYVNSPTSTVLALHLLATLTIASSKGAGRRLRERDALAAELDLHVEET